MKNLAETGNVSNSCYVAGITRPGAYKARKSDEAFAEAWDVAEEDAVQSLELEARRRAFDGVEKPVFHAGVECGRINQYSDVLMMFLLKAHRPDTYRDRVSLDHGGSLDASGAQQIELVIVPTKKTDAGSSNDDTPS